MRVKKDSYNASSIRVLKFPETVRQRASLWIGSVDNPNHLAFEIIDNGVDENLSGHCDSIVVVIGANGYLTVTDNGRGIPFDKHKETGKSATDVIMTFLHAGAKFDNDSYKTSGGLHGVGASVVNALSEHLIVESRRGGKRMTREYKRGEPAGKMKIVEGPKKSGTTVSFKPDDKIFKTTHFSFQVIKTRLEEISFLNDGLKVRLTDERTGEVFEAKYSNGLAAYVKSIEQNCDPLNGIIYVSKESKELGVEVHCALQWKSGLDSERILAFTNTIRQEDGGTHVVGFKNALTRIVNKYMAGKKDSDIVTSDDIRTGLVAIIDVRMSSPQFSSQVKSKLVSESARTVVESISSELEEYFEKNQSYISKICSLAASAARAREAAKTARELVRQTVTATMASPLMGKLADCQSKKPSECELFICEGDSASGTAKMGRDRKYQAILPLRGKIINAEKASLKKLLDNNEIQSIVAAVGTGIGKNFDIGNLRYHKIFLMCDADSVTGDTPILIDSNGYLRLVTMENLVKTPELQNGCEVSSCDTQRGVFSSHPVDQFIRHGTDKQLYRIETENGYSVKVTADHNMFVHNGSNIICRRTMEIKPKDNIVLPAILPRKDSVVSFGRGRGKMVMSSKIAHFVGICLGAKVVMVSKNSASISLNSDWRVDRATHAIKALGGSWLVKRTDSGYIVKIIGGKPVSIIKSLSLVGARDFPNEIFNVTRHVQAAFLNGYFSSAGCSVNANDHSYFVCYGSNEISTGIVTVLRQMSQWPKIYRSGNGTLVEISSKGMQSIVSCARIADKKSGVSYKLLKVKSVVEIDNEENLVYDLSVPSHQNFVAGDGGFLLHNTDGEHIRVLLLTFFYRFMNDLITNGHIYVAQPPLYRCIWGGKARYALSDKELLALKIGKRFGFLQIKTSGVWSPIEPIDIIGLGKSTRIRSEGSKKSFTVSEILSEASVVNDIKIQRFKGLGEMSDEQLWDTTLNPENRKLIQIQIPDAEMADKMVELLMGNDIESRRQYILDNCDMADLDT